VGDHVVRLEVLRAHGRPASREIAGRRDEDQSRLAHAPRHQRTVRQRADAQGEVDAFLDQVHHPIDHQHRRGDPRLGAQEVCDQRHDMHPAEGHGAGDRDVSGRRRRLAGRVPLGGRDLAEQAAGAFQVARPGLGEAHPAGGPVQQTCTEAVLQRGDGARHRRRRHPQAGAGRGEATCLGDRDEDLHGAQAVHAHSFNRRNSLFHPEHILARGVKRAPSRLPA
jgi:hypothetical protein